MKSEKHVPHQKYVLKNNEDNDCINSEIETLIFNNNNGNEIKSNKEDKIEKDINKDKDDKKIEDSKIKIN